MANNQTHLSNTQDSRSVLPTSPPDLCTSEEAEAASLVRMTLEGDQAAFASLVRRYQKPLFNLALRMTGNEEDAKDITQAAFVKAYENLRSFDTRQRFFSWLYRIGVNEALNRLRTTNRHESLDPEMPSSADDPEQELARKRTRQSVQESILQLTPEHRAVILLRHFNDMTYEEMGFVLGIPVKTVKSRLYSARQTLAGLLA